MKHVLMTLFALVLGVSTLAHADLIKQGQPLPSLQVDALGELVLAEDDFSYQPWNSDQPAGKAHVLQYFPGTMAASKIYEPFTDSLQAQYELGTYHVTTVINLDAAMWGTRGFVESEVKKSKRKFPGSTMVLDKAGTGVNAWQLGESGSGLFIVDASGKVHFHHNGALSEDDMARAESVFAELMQP